MSRHSDRTTSFRGLESQVSRVTSPRDRLYPVRVAQYGPGHHTSRSGLQNLDALERLLTAQAAKHLRDCESIVDFACHYGRLLRCLRPCRIGLCMPVTSTATPSTSALASSGACLS